MILFNLFKCFSYGSTEINFGFDACDCYGFSLLLLLFSVLQSCAKLFFFFAENIFVGNYEAYTA